MKRLILKLPFILIGSALIFSETLPLTQRFFHTEDMGHTYTRGTYFIVLADSTLKTALEETETGNFVHFKQTQGYDVVVESIDKMGGTADNIRNYLLEYAANENVYLEYVLLIGDVDNLGSYTVPTHFIMSYNEAEFDVTDYTYTYQDNEILHPEFFIGRWSIRSTDDLKKIKLRSIQYIKMENIQDYSFLNKAMTVAGNYSDGDLIPVTPVWTSNWLKDELIHFGYNQVDTAYYYNESDFQWSNDIEKVWNDGVGIINYRGWGDAKGWKYPAFRNVNIDGTEGNLNNGWRLPVVLSFVCNTGDFGNDGVPSCFGEKMVTAGSLNNPKGAAAMVGPSDLDTDTRFNNVLCAVMWDEMLEGRIPELAPALHAGKQAIKTEFHNLKVNGTKIPEFYNHVYGVLGDPSLPVWLGEPKQLSSDLAENTLLTNSLISTVITGADGKPVMDVVGALLANDTLIAKGLSNHNGELVIDFSGVLENTNLELYLNKPQYFQKKINLTFSSDEGSTMQTSYSIPETQDPPLYIAIDSKSGHLNAPLYNWIDITEIGENLGLTDDSVLPDKDIGFSFSYYNEVFEKITVCSNGWASFLPCLSTDGTGKDCTTIPYFFNNSIAHPAGPRGMLAPFFDDLDDNQGKEDFNVFFWSNNTDSLIIQWDNVANGQHDENCVIGDADSCPRHTFQLLLNAKASGNGDILFQYKHVTEWKNAGNDPTTLWHVDDHGATVGIEAPDKNSGTEYLFYDEYQNASGIQIELAIRFLPNCQGGADPVSGFDCSGNCITTTDCKGICGGTTQTDECGVCGGLGAVYECGCEDIPVGACDCDGNTLDCSGICGGSDDACLNIENEILPDQVSISAYPNPFNPFLNINVDIPQFQHVNISINDLNGRSLKNLTEGNITPGYHTFIWDAGTYPSGVYLITVKIGKKNQTQKVLLLK